MHMKVVVIAKYENVVGANRSCQKKEKEIKRLIFFVCQPPYIKLSSDIDHFEKKPEKCRPLWEPNEILDLTLCCQQWQRSATYMAKL